MYHDETYSKKALIPFWVVHLIFSFLLIAAFAVFMMEVAGELEYEPPPLSAFMFFLCVALVLEPLEMVLQSYRYLEPWLYLSFQVYKALLSTIFLIYEIYEFTKRGERQQGVWKWVSILIIALCGCTIVTYYASLIYGALVFKRHRKTKSDWDYVKERSGSDDD